MKNYKYLIVPSAALAIFIIWTILVKTVDVHYIQSIGFLGFYQLNTSINDKIQAMNTGTFNTLTNVLLYASFATIVPLAVIVLIQWVKRKSLLKVDSIFFYLLGAYILIGICYIVFEIVKINFSPLSTPEDLKPSYPSTHTFAFIAVLVVNAYAYAFYFKLPKMFKIGASLLVIALSILMAVLRLLSGHHYMTDIVGGVLLALSIILFFIFFFKKFAIAEEEQNIEQEKVE